MVPIAPELKTCLESCFLVILLLYAIRSEWRRKNHLTSFVSLLLCVPLAIDVFIFHAIRPPAVWAVLNLPFTVVVGVMIYVRIVRKGWRKVLRCAVSLFLLLVGR